MASSEAGAGHVDLEIGGSGSGRGLGWLRTEVGVGAIGSRNPVGRTDGRGEVRRPSVRSTPGSPPPAGISRSAPAGRPRGRWSGSSKSGPGPPSRRAHLISSPGAAPRRRPPPAPICIRPSPARRGQPSPSSAPTPGAPIFFLLPGSPRRSPPPHAAPPPRPRPRAPSREITVFLHCHLGKYGLVDQIF